MDGARERIASTLVTLVAEHGYAAVDLERIQEQADVDAATFKRYFSSKQDCFDRVWAEMANEFIADLRTAYDNEGAWRDSLRASAYFILRYFQAYEDRTRFFMLGVLEAGPLAEARRDLIMQVGIDIVDGGRQELADPNSVRRARAEAIVLSIYESILAEMAGPGGVEALPGLVPRLMHDAVLPYLGPEVATEELTVTPLPPP